MVSSPESLAALGGDAGVSAHGHARPTPGSIDECEQCAKENHFSVTRALASRPGHLLSVQFPSAATYERLFADYAGPFRAYLWVMRRDGTVILSPDPAASGSRPFDGAVDPSFAETMTAVRSFDRGVGQYRWIEPDGRVRARLVAWRVVPGAGDLVVLYSGDQEGALARTDAFTDDARHLFALLVVGLTLLALFIGVDTHLRLRRERAAHDQVALTEARYRTMVGQAADMLLEVSQAQVITSINEATRRCLGDIVGSSLADLFLVDHSDTLDTARQHLHSDEFVEGLKAQVRTVSGEAIPVSVRASCIRVTGLQPFEQWALRDLSALEREHQRVIQMEKLSTIGRLTATVSHEIKNPLSSIHTNAQHAKSVIEAAAIEGRAEIVDVLDDILSAVQQIDGVIKAVGGVVRQNPNHRHIDLRDTVKSAIVLAGPRLHRGRGLTLELPSALPVMGAAGELSQIAVNLLVNAAQAVSKVEAGQITVRGWTEAEQVVLTIEDNGGGIAEQHLNRLFDPFFTTRATGEGTGLGLAVSREIAHRHCGHLTCVSEDGHTRFELRLPRAVAPGRLGELAA